MKRFLVLTIFLIGLGIAAAGYDTHMYTEKEIHDKCKWSPAHLQGKNYLSTTCGEYWYCRYIWQKTILLAKCTGKDNRFYFDIERNDGEGVSLQCGFSI